MSLTNLTNLRLITSLAQVAIRFQSMFSWNEYTKKQQNNYLHFSQDHAPFSFNLILAEVGVLDDVWQDIDGWRTEWMHG